MVQAGLFDGKLVIFAFNSNFKPACPLPVLWAESNGVCLCTWLQCLDRICCRGLHERAAELKGAHDGRVFEGSGPDNGRRDETNKQQQRTGHDCAQRRGVTNAYGDCLIRTTVTLLLPCPATGAGGADRPAFATSSLPPSSRFIV